MKVIRGAIDAPVTTAVGVILLVLFGSLALSNIPVQLTPTVEEPQVTIQTFWPGASPAEIEREIVDEQEEQLKSLDGLLEMESSSQDGFGQIILTFAVGSDKDASLLKVANRLEQVPRYPDDAEKPIILTSDPNNSAMAWFILLRDPENPFEGEIWTLYDFVDDQIKPALERVPGVAQSNFFGGREREMQVLVDPGKLAARHVTLNQLAAALDRENRSYSGGDLNEGKRRYVVRTVGEYTSSADIESVVIAVAGGVPVYVRDVATVELGYRRAGDKLFFRDQQTIALSAIQEPGANIIDSMDGLKATVADLNAGILADRGLHLVQAYDETEYIDSAINLVQQSLIIGGVLAVLVLLLFLRSRASTLVVALAIPISVVGTFLLLHALGRTLNVVSLAGMAFAVGMVVDNAIVVLENIYRHRQMGKERARAAYDGTVEVWGAVLASTLTTIAVFVPILFIEEEAGQLFRDIALAISCGVGLSLAVAVTVIPSLSAKILDARPPRGKREEPEDPESEAGTESGVAPRAAGVTGLARRFSNWIGNTVYWICGSTLRRLAVVLGFTVSAIGLSFLLIPKAEYLPLGNMNFVFGFMLPPPGYNLDEVATFNDIYNEVFTPLIEAEGDEAAALPGGGVESFFFGALPNQGFVGASSRDPLRAHELLGVFQQAHARMPGTIAFASQVSLFDRGLGEGRNIDVEITGPELEKLIGLGLQIMGGVQQALPNAQAVPIPGLDLGNPEVQVVPDRRRAAELGISNRDLGFVVNALVDGAKASDYRHEGREIDLVVKASPGEQHRTHLIEQLPIATPDGQLVTLGSVARVEMVNGPVQINHRERQRTITIQVTPPDEIPLQAAMETLQSSIIEPLRAAGEIGGLYRISLSGSADKLTQTREALAWNFLLAVVITYLLMAALFESFLYPMVIMFSVPLAALGGFLGLGLLNQFSYQPLDVLTMLGFIILVGTVVNNAILIVHQSLNLLRRSDLAPREAIRDATLTRVRPIFMSVFTSLSGMLPLVLFPGAGSELYRGLGSVVVGGLAVSTFFTLFLVPALFSLVIDGRRAVASRLRMSSDDRAALAE